uniref:Uncharacterized protein n=1 Tax=Angiostrongylus cantonensis TaxID=6313 RepID=A0A0K0D171_ANGCA
MKRDTIDCCSEFSLVECRSRVLSQRIVFSLQGGCLVGVNADEAQVVAAVGQQVGRHAAEAAWRVCDRPHRDHQPRDECHQQEALGDSAERCSEGAGETGMSSVDGLRVPAHPGDDPALATAQLCDFC